MEEEDESPTTPMRFTLLRDVLDGAAINTPQRPPPLSLAAIPTVELELQYRALSTAYKARQDAVYALISAEILARGPLRASALQHSPATQAFDAAIDAITTCLVQELRCELEALAAELHARDIAEAEASPNQAALLNKRDPVDAERRDSTHDTRTPGHAMSELSVQKPNGGLGSEPACFIKYEQDDL